MDTQFLGEAGMNYEYSVTVARRTFALLVAGVGGAVDADLLDLLKSNPELSSRAWLEVHGVPFHFWCY